MSSTTQPNAGPGEHVTSTVAVLYAAKSTEDPNGSIRDQLTDGEALAAREGMKIVSRHQDEAASAYHGNRGDGLTKAMAECEEQVALEGRWGVALVVQHSDRLARGDAIVARHLVQIMLWAMDAGVRLRSAQDQYNLPEPWEPNALTAAANAGQRNNEDSRRKGLSVRDGLRRRAERGQSRGGPRPYGYQRAYELDERGQRRSRYVVDEAEAVIVRRIFNDFVSGMSHRGIAAALMDEHVPSQNGASWPQATVRRILSRKLYVGIVEDKDGNEYPGEHEPIVERDLFDRARAMSKRRQERNVGGRWAGGQHLLVKGLLRCGQCGSAMYPRKARARPGEYYYCGGRMNWGVAYCDQAAIPRHEIDTALMAHLTRHLLDMDETKRQLEERRVMGLQVTRARVVEAEAQLAKAEARVKRIRRDYQDGALPIEDYTSMKAELEPELEAARAEAKQAAEQAATADEEDRANAGFDSEAELLRVLAQHQAVASGVERASEVNLDALRMMLAQAFETVRYFRTDHPLYPTEYMQTRGEKLAHGILAPMLADDTILGWVGDVPTVRKFALPVDSGGSFSTSPVEGRTV